jgi:starch synthase
MSAPRRILFVASECLPFAKAGGLGDVVSALSKALVRRGHDARILLPLYGSIDRDRFGIEPLAPVCVHMGNGEEVWAGLWRTTLDGLVPVYFLEYQRFYGRPAIYNEAWEYGDNPWRFALLSKSALQMAVDLEWTPDVVHVHDWPTSLVPVYLAHLERRYAALAGTASVLTIHNVEYQGKFPADALDYIGLPPAVFNPGELEDHGGLNFLKCGVAFADVITTVSPTHASEMTGAVGGHGLGPHLARRAGVTVGILNGVDEEVWNPESDPLLSVRFSHESMRGKLECKQALQARFGLDPRPDVPLFGIVSRFAAQKGLGLVRDALPPLLRGTAMQLVVLGSGDPELEGFFSRLRETHPHSVGSSFGYSEELAHLIEAGADFFLMPSLYEPCGLNQMYSMRYGTLPIVRATGGLADTVVDADATSDAGTGFVFHEPTPAALADAIGRAIRTWYWHPSQIARMRRAAMVRRFGWDESAARYDEVYERAIATRRGVVERAPAPSDRRPRATLREGSTLEAGGDSLRRP